MKTPLIATALAVTLAMLPTATATEEEDCEPGSSLALVSYSYVVGNVTYSDLSELAGHLEAGTQVTAILEFEGCGEDVVTFVAYHAEAGFSLVDQTVADFDTQAIVNGTVELTVTVPDCLFQLDLVYGEVIFDFAPPNVTYHAEFRFLDGLQDGELCDDEPTPTPTVTPTPPTPTPTPPTEIPFFPTATAVGLGLVGLIAAAMVVLRRKA